MHLLKALLLQLPRRPDSMTFSRSNQCSQCHTCSLRCQPHLAHQRHCQNRQLRLHRRNLRRRNTSSSMRRTMKTWLWIHSNHCSQQILLYYLYLNINRLLQHLEASRSRSRTHSEVSEAPTIQYPDPAPDPPRQSGQEEAPLPQPSLPPPDPLSRSSSVAPTEFYSDIAKGTWTSACSTG